MSLVVAENVSKSYDEARYVLSGVSLGVSDGQRIGLVGPNGEGKTTLLKLLAALETPTTGRVQRKRGLRIGYLPQDPPAPDETPLWRSALGVFDDVRRLEADLAEAAKHLAEGPADKAAMDRYGRLQAAFEARGGYTYEQRMRTVLTGLGFGERQYAAPLSRLSGGQRTRALLGRLLLGEPDLLLLDEPTNHLDVEHVEWLERWLLSQPAAMVIVSHDRRFLDRTAEQIWECAFGRIEIYRCGYRDYLQQRQVRHIERLRQYRHQQEYIRDTEDFIRRHIAGQRGREARGRRTRLERFLKDQAVERPRQTQRIKLRLTPAARGGDLVFSAGGLVIGYEPDKPLLAAGDLEVRRGQRVAIVGPNGAGKTTLIRTLLGQVAPLEGRVRGGAGLDVGYMSQTHEDLRAQATVLQSVLEADAAMKPERARTVLGAFGLAGDDVHKRIADLSGGERSRVILALLAAARPNVLVLDEPTNHLDIPSQEIVQQVLGGFAGTLMFVTHDRELIQALATHVWFFQGESLLKHPGGWDEFVRWRAGRRGAAAAPADVRTRRGGRPGAGGPPAESREQARRRKRRRERAVRRLAELENREIPGLEQRLGELSAEITAAGEAGQMDKVRQFGRDYQQADTELKTLWAEWEELTESLEA